VDQKKFGVLILIISAIGFGTLGLWGKLAYSTGLSPLQLLAARFILSGIILWLVTLIFFRKKIKVSINELIFLFIQGGILYTLTSYGFFLSLQTLKVSLATILFFLHPIYTYFITAFILKKRISIRKWIALFISLIGITLVIDITNISISDSGKGMIFAVLAGLCYSIFTVNNGINKNNISGFTTTLYTITFSGLTMGFLASIQLNGWLAFNLSQIQVIIGISLIGTILGIFCFVEGIKLVGATTASVVSVFEPLSGVFLAFVFLDETISYIQSLGIAIVLLAVYLVTTKRKLAIKN